MFGIPSIWMAVAGAVLFGLVVWKSYDTGYDYASARCDTRIADIKIEFQKKFDEEVKRLQAAADASREQQEKLAEELIQKDKVLDQLLLQLEEEARNDPDSGNCGISESSVDRLNRIK